MIEQQADGRWHVVITLDDGTTLTKGFQSEGRAKAWQSRRLAAKAAHADDADPDIATMTLDEALERYGREVSALKRGAKVEGYRLAKLRQAPIAAMLLTELTSKAVADHRNARAEHVGASSIRSEVSLIRQTIDRARREWGVPLTGPNPAAQVTLPPPGPSRNRTLTKDEMDALLRELEGHPLVASLVEFAAKTAMRRGELLALKWRDVHLGRGVLHVPMSKNGKARHVPLTNRALLILTELTARGELVFPIDIHALRWAWTSATKRAALTDIRFHDLRHMAVTALFDMGLSVPEVALISGHKTPSMLFRYTHPDAERVRAKLAALSLGPR